MRGETHDDSQIGPDKEGVKECVRHLEGIRGGRKGSMGSIDNVYIPQLNRANLDKLYERLKAALEHLEGKS
jgi:hypothetical protein